MIRGLDLQVMPHRATALIGPNGAGKTTIFNLISGVYVPSHGSIHVGGADVTHVRSRDRIRHGVARSFQNIRLMPHLTVLENLLLGEHAGIRPVLDMLVPYGWMPKHRWRQQAFEALEAYGLQDYAGRPVGGLSYGIRKQVDLVRATLCDPTLLLLDEPAAGLNPTESAQLLEHLEKLRERGITLVVIEHDMHFIQQLCEHVVVLNFGEKIAEGTLSEVSAMEAVRTAYLGSSQEE